MRLIRATGTVWSHPQSLKSYSPCADPGLTKEFSWQH